MSSGARTVLHVGTSLETKGGIASVERVLIGDPPEGWTARHIGTHVDGSPWAKWVAWRRGARALRAMLQGPSPPDVVHVHTASNASWWRKRRVLAMAARAGVPAVFTIHGGGFADFCAARGGRAGRQVQAAVAAGAVPAVLTLTWIERLAPWLEAPLVVPNPGPAPVAVQADERDPSRVLFVARDDAAKGVDIALQAFAVARAEHPDLTLHIAGLSADAVHAAGQPTDGVTFLGWLGRDELEAELATASLQIAPSRLEGFPMAVLDALGHGLPVLASHVAGDAVGDAGEVLEHLDPTQWGERIAAIMADAERLAAWSAAAPSHVEPFQLDAVQARWAEVYADLLA